MDGSRANRTVIMDEQVAVVASLATALVEHKTEVMTMEHVIVDIAKTIG